MTEAVIVGALSFGAAFFFLLWVEAIIHRLTRNPDKSYKLGVWTFAILVGIWMFLTSLGR